jgi:hypothetical protein
VAIEMHITQRQEQFNIAYIAAMAAQAGLNHSRPTVDDDSVDLILMGKGYGGVLKNPQIHLQLKCTSQDLIQGDVIKYPLNIKNYNDLRGDSFISPRYLVVLLIPQNEQEWIVHQSECMKLHNQCYWVSIKDHPDTINTTSVTVDIPLNQRLTTDTLRHLMADASNG